MAESSSIPIRSAPELLAPAGDWACARAAVENGADAIYFGLDRFNARMRAENFTLTQLPDLMRFLHERGVRGYVTFNTLIFTEELPDAEDYLRKLIECGVDAAIVQDIGICRLIRKISPDFPINASTQMSITSAEGIRFSEALGAYVTALGRECSLDEIEKIQFDRLEKNPQASSLPLEVFVHGALCVSCSGQCLASEALGKRSANRGECAQPCRLPYQLICDGEPMDLNGRHFLLSPTDVAGLELLPRFIRAGVTSLKIEGRLKSPEYVASVCRTYRKAIDSAMELGNHLSVSEKDYYEMEMTFSRGLGTGWLKGIDLQKSLTVVFPIITAINLVMLLILNGIPFGFVRLLPSNPVTASFLTMENRTKFFRVATFTTFLRTAIFWDWSSIMNPLTPPGFARIIRFIRQVIRNYIANCARLLHPKKSYIIVPLMPKFPATLEHL